MSNLPDIKKENAIAIFQSGGAVKSIEVRRKMVDIPEVAIALNQTEKLVFAASTKTLISEMTDEDLVKKTAQLFKFIAMDVGYNIPNDQTEWQYTCTRIMNILQRHYSNLTLADVKLSFELATIGELDEFLPRDKNGNGDKNHYQNFNVDYFAKILNAFVRKRGAIIIKAYKALPEPDNGISDKQKQENHNNIVRKLINCFLSYKYLGKVPEISNVAEMLVYELLVELGFAKPIVISNAEKSTALYLTLSKVNRGMINYYDGLNVKKEGYDHDTVKMESYFIGRRKALIETFAEMVKEEIYIYDYIKEV